MVLKNTTSIVYVRMIWQYKEYDAERSMKAAQRELTEALSIVNRPHLYGTALFHVNAALRRLADAQWRLMQAKSEYEFQQKHHGLDKN